MITGAHSIIYTRDAEADREFMARVFKLPAVDVGGGWLIFGLPPSELAFHPAKKNAHQELFLLCDDITKFVGEMKQMKVPCGRISRQPWGILTSVTLPGGGKLGVYEPLHARPRGKRPVVKRPGGNAAPPGHKSAPGWLSGSAAVLVAEEHAAVAEGARPGELESHLPVTPSNIVLPPPRTSGITTTWYSSISLSGASCAMMVPLPMIAIPSPCSALSLRITAGTFPFTSVVLAHAAESMVREKTTLGISFIRLATTGSFRLAAGVGQYPAMRS